jgi:hypothetical protein
VASPAWNGFKWMGRTDRLPPPFPVHHVVPRSRPVETSRTRHAATLLSDDKCQVEGLDPSPPGEVNGERPYSAIKIALAVIAALAIALVLAWLEGG